VALRSGIHEAAQRAYNNLQISLITIGASATERAALIAEGLDHARRHGLEGGTTSYLLSIKGGLEFGAGEWDTMLVTVGGMHDASPVYRFALVARAWVATARESPVAALPIYADLASRMTGDETALIAGRGALAAGLAGAGRLDEARAHLAALSELIAPYGARAGTLDTPRSLLGGPLARDVLMAALLLDQPQWIETVEAEITDESLAPSNRQAVLAARALRAGDAAACARALEAAYPRLEHVGFAGNWHHTVVGCVQFASMHGLALGAEWAPIAARTRAFAGRVGAKYWLAVLEQAGL
jgi:hypothetical protein